MDISSLLAKCSITSSQITQMPSLAYYLKERYQLPEVAIDDVRLFLHFVQTKYQKEIDQRQSLHREYWEEQCDWVISFTQKSRSYNL